MADGRARAWRVVLVLATSLTGGCAPGAGRPAPPATFVGGAACAPCHPAEDRAWRGSHHQLAMQPASDSTVLGDFHDASFTYGSVVSRFFRRDGRFLVRTDGPDGRLADYEIEYTFGVSPLQQYLIGFPGGRLQALGIAWDSRPREQGGHRWFHLYPGEHVTHGDELHWTRARQNWNQQCAVCHSTDLRKNYDPVTRRYRTSWSELSVGCEACHGPGSRHLAWAGKGARARGADRAAGGRAPGGAASMGLLVRLDERRGVVWTRDPVTDLPQRSLPRGTDDEIEMCARCHSRRARMFDDDPAGSPLMSAHLPALLTDGLYHADGQIEGEVYEYGSFVQSRMYHEGVTCGDCHDPHRLELRAEGNALCLRCHDGARYDVAAHSHHEAGSRGARCVACHMPVTTFMVVDPRHDHSFRVPRPDLADSLGTTDVCASCHAGKTARWALERLREWYGHDPVSFQRFAGALGAARRGDANAQALILALLADRRQPAIARGTAVAALAERFDATALAAIRAALRDPDPWVRLGGVRAAGDAPADERWELLEAAVRDSSRVLRALAGEAMAGTPIDRVPAEGRAALERARADYLAAETGNSDEPSALVNLGNFHAAEGDAAGAEQAFRAALEIDPDWVPACANLADLLRATGRDDEAGAVLRTGLARHPEAAALHHALGLWLVRQKRPGAALVELGRAAALAPDNAHFAYVYAIGLNDAGRTREALAVAERGLARRPGDRALAELSALLRRPPAAAPARP